MPDALELPWVLRAVVPFVSANLAFIDEFVTLRLGHAVGADQLLRFASGRIPGFATVVGALGDLAEPPAGLRSVNAVRIHRRTFDVINLPTREVRAADLPILALAIRG